MQFMTSSASAPDLAFSIRAAKADPIIIRAAKQNAVVHRQMARHSMLGVSRKLMPPCNTVYRALPPKMKPDADNLLARTSRGEHNADHNMCMMALLLCERPVGGSSPRPSPKNGMVVYSLFHFNFSGKF